VLIKRSGAPIVYLDDVRKKLFFAKNKKAPDTSALV